MSIKTVFILCLFAFSFSYAQSDLSPRDLVGHYDSKEPLLNRIGYLLNPNRVHYNYYKLDLYSDSTFNLTSCGVESRIWQIEQDTLILTGLYSDSAKAEIARDFPEIDTSAFIFRRKFHIEQKNGQISLKMCGQVRSGKSNYKKWCLIMRKRD